MGIGRFLRSSLMGAAVLLGGSILAPTAWADTVYTLTQANIAFPGPYGTVTVHLVDSDEATITFNSLTNSGNIYLFGDGGSVAVNVNAASWTLSNITGSNAGTGFSPGPYSDGGAGNEDGFGSFNQTINSFDGFTSSSDTISFLLTNTSGTWANSGSVLINNADGFLAAAHIFVTAFPANASNGAIATGFATTPGPILGAGAPGLVAACVGLLGLARRRRKRIA
jgi:hypothetical protein